MTIIKGMGRRSAGARQIRLILLFGIALIAGIFLSNGLFSAGFSPGFDRGFVVQAQTSIPMAGGTTTVSNRSSNAYEQPSAGLSAAEVNRHLKGDLAFEAVFVTAPAPLNSGLGPLFNNASCAGCHLRNGRGLPQPGQLLARVSLPAIEASSSDAPGMPIANYHPEATVDLESTPPVPGLGTQIQDHGVYGQAPEATVDLQWQEQTGQYGDGTPYRLRSPQPHITLRDGSPLPPSVQVSLRLPPPVFGLGLLEAVPDTDILALADPEDRNQDGISGRPNQVWDVVQQTTALGRFGLKANQPNLLQQSAAAYVNDMGITNPLFPNPDGSSDIDRTTLDQATFYVQTLAVPGRTLLNDPEVQRGEMLFTVANCAACHVSELRTGNHPIPVLTNQVIHPYTDLLLHDLGDGLADHRSDFQATGTEWRTSPLWGIGLTQTVLPYSSYLHDGRARTLEEAILWHSGEAEASKEAFRTMSAADRAALIRFLRSL
jgi:CxxC motif-containing protein (DUF1111 family)